MRSKLTIDNDFTPCPESDGDEFFPNGIFIFNITKMTEHIMDNPELFVPEDQYKAALAAGLLKKDVKMKI